MSTHSRPLWFEGQLVRPQHLQQQQRWLEALLEDRMRGAGCDGWGVWSLTLDASMLALGRVGIESCVAIMPDGLPLEIPGRDVPPAPLEVPPGTVNTLVKLAVPMRAHDRLEIGPPTARFRRAEVSLGNSTGSGQPAEVVVGVPNAALVLDGADEAELVTVPLARVARVTPAGEVVLDLGFVPPALRLGAHPRLTAFAREIEGMLSGRADAVAARVDPARAGAGLAGMIDFALLQLLNESQPLFAAFGRASDLRPFELYREALRLAGALSTFSRNKRRPPALPDWDHRDPGGCLAALIAAIRDALAVLSVESAVALPLQARRQGIWVSPISDRALLTGASFVLAVTAAVDSERIRSVFPAQAKIGPAEAIRDLVSLQLPGIPLRPLPVAPRDIPYRTGTVYFELDRGAEIWRQLQNSPAFILHVGADIPGLALEFWAIRQG
ncbi:MAG: type VI secretion system baseplate subunit TssK [Proteobacteria bacterium]|nr:type VI secretion system baseplate subunit TssK [Pseudomonadota bacterium]